MPDSATAKATFRRILWLSVLIPVVAMTVLAGILIGQVTKLLSQARWVEHSDEVIVKLYKAEATLIDGQAGLRGYLLSGDERYLMSFTAASSNLPAQMADLRWITRDRPQAGEICDTIERERARWVAFVQGLIDQRRATGQVPPFLRDSPAAVAMDATRGAFTTWLDQEIQLRAERNATTQWWARLTLIGAGGVTVILGVVLALLGRSQLGWLAKSYEAALGRARELSASLERRVEERTEALTTANGQLGDANKELEAFAYSISHDLRAPMRHITGFADLVRKSPAGRALPVEDLENLDIIHNTAVLAGRMVDDLLAFSRVGRTQLRVGEVDLNGVVAQCVAELEPETRGRQLVWKIEPLAPAKGDAALLKMVFQNLLGNAVKYTQKRDHAEVSVCSRPERDGTTYEIRDNGVGFDMAYVHKLFGVFQRLHRAEDFEGTGIGLANARRIITRHGGQVWAEGVAGQGAAFFIHLPE